jgi:sugar O-acyltransferase (sialic acid O-acetyltransferase NeuD family)
MQHNSKDIAIYGAGGFGREVACLIRRINSVSPQWNFIGFFDDGLSEGNSNEYGKVIGNIDTLNAWDKPLAIVLAMGNPQVVFNVHNKISNDNISFPNIISPDISYIDENNVRIGIGNIISVRCLISCNVTIGNFNSFIGLDNIGHDVTINDYNSIMPAVCISGGVKIGNRNLLGVNSVVLQYQTIGNDTIIGAGSVMWRSTKDKCTYSGVPAIRINK